MEELFELFAEIALELYIGLFAELLPEHKFKKWQTVLLKLLCMLISIGSLVLIIGGIILLARGIGGDFAAGLSMTVVGAAIVIAHIAIFIIVVVKEQKRLKNNKTATKENDNDR